MNQVSGHAVTDELSTCIYRPSYHDGLCLLYRPIFESKEENIPSTSTSVLNVLSALLSLLTDHAVADRLIADQVPAGHSAAGPNPANPAASDIQSSARSPASCAVRRARSPFALSALKAASDSAHQHHPAAAAAAGAAVVFIVAGTIPFPFLAPVSLHSVQSFPAGAQDFYCTASDFSE